MTYSLPAIQVGCILTTVLLATLCSCDDYDKYVLGCKEIQNNTTQLIDCSPDRLIWIKNVYWGRSRAVCSNRQYEGIGYLTQALSKMCDNQTSCDIPNKASSSSWLTVYFYCKEVNCKAIHIGQEDFISCYSPEETIVVDDAWLDIDRCIKSSNITEQRNVTKQTSELCNGRPFCIIALKSGSYPYANVQYRCKVRTTHTTSSHHMSTLSDETTTETYLTITNMSVEYVSSARKETTKHHTVALHHTTSLHNTTINNLSTVKDLSFKYETSTPQYTTRMHTPENTTRTHTLEDTTRLQTSFSILIGPELSTEQISLNSKSGTTQSVYSASQSDRFSSIVDATTRSELSKSTDTTQQGGYYYKEYTTQPQEYTTSEQRQNTDASYIGNTINSIVASVSLVSTSKDLFSKLALETSRIPVSLNDIGIMNNSLNNLLTKLYSPKRTTVQIKTSQKLSYNYKNKQMTSTENYFAAKASESRSFSTTSLMAILGSVVAAIIAVVSIVCVIKWRKTRVKIEDRRSDNMYIINSQYDNVCDNSNSAIQDSKDKYAETELNCQSWEEKHGFENHKQTRNVASSLNNLYHPHHSYTLGSTSLYLNDHISSEGKETPSDTCIDNVDTETLLTCT